MAEGLLGMSLGHEPSLLLWTLTLALAVDLIFGEPANAYHPVAYLGQAIAWLEERLYQPPPNTPGGDFHDMNGLRGFLLVAVIVGGGLGLGMFLASAIDQLAAFIATRFGAPSLVHAMTAVALSLCLKPCFALRALVAEGAFQRRLLFRHRILTDGDESTALNEARERLRHLCSRNTTQLTSEEIAEVTISSMAENLCDSFVAPLLFYAVFGLPGAIAYRAINTLDAMVGYRGRYEFFGRPAARLDDFANVVPARLTGVLLVLGGWLASFAGAAADPRRGLGTMLRDHSLTPSPNGGWPMAAMAGLLGVRLRKRGVYALGDSLKAAGDTAIATSLIVTGWAAALAVVVTLIVSRCLFDLNFGALL